MIQMAWTMPGINPKMVNKTFIQKCFPKPTVKKTPKGGKMMAKIILRILMLECLVLKRQSQNSFLVFRIEQKQTENEA